VEEAVHPYLISALAAERTRDWQQRTARAGLARQARRGRRSRKLAARALPPLAARPAPQAQPAAGQRGGQQGWEQPAAARAPAAAEECQPAGTRA
jgi:hypothetical protein